MVPASFMAMPGGGGGHWVEGMGSDAAASAGVSLMSLTVGGESAELRSSFLNRQMPRDRYKRTPPDTKEDRPVGSISA